MKIKLLFTFCILYGFVSAQQNKIDSLLFLIKKDKEDTNKVNHINFLAFALYSTNPDTTILLADQAAILAKRTNFPKGEANAYSAAGVGYWAKGNYPNALDNFLYALKIDEELNNKKGVATRLGNIGSVYHQQGDYPKALDYYLKALKMNEELGNKNLIGTVLGKIGGVYWHQGDYSKALNYYFKALKTAEELEDKNLITYWIGSIGNVYYEQTDYPKALDYYSKALKMAEELGDKNLIASWLGNIGVVYKDQKDYRKALNCYFKALKIAEELGDKKEIASIFGSIGALYTDTKKYAEAEKYLIEALKLGKEIGAMNDERVFEETLSQLYDTTGRHKLALLHYKKAMELKDTIFSQENKKELVRKEMNYEFDKKEAVANAVHKKEIENQQAIADEKSRKQKIITYSVSGGLILVLLLALFIFRGYKQKQKANKELAEMNLVIEQQKKLVEEHNKDITDSINYAQRIQKALLASDNILNKNLAEHFVLFKPKDIVSGDFYWATEKDGRFYLAVCDSTGHGVPGAFMSLLNISFLNEAISEKGIKQPNEVLNHARQRLIENLSSEGAKDGMDGILVCFDRNKNEISYAAAHNSPILIANGTLEELESDNMPVGLADRLDSFKLEKINATPGAVLLLYTDGFADQFGGPKGKKFKYKQLNDLLLANGSKVMTEQKDVFEKTFEDWKGNLEQVDDVLLIGIRI